MTLADIEAESIALAFGAAVKRLREQAGLSLNQLSGAAQPRRISYSRWLDIRQRCCWNSVAGTRRSLRWPRSWLIQG
jgi:hypothetical protein